jgi:hypothetical protein
MRAFRYFLIAGAVIFGLLSYATSALTVYASPEQETKFFQSFDPVAVLNSLGLACYEDGESAEKVPIFSNGASSGAGSSFWFSRKPVEHTREVGAGYCGDSAKIAAVMSTLEESTLRSLGNARCEATDVRMTDEKGLSVKYRCGNRATGTVTVQSSPSGSSAEVHYNKLTTEVRELWMP